MAGRSPGAKSQSQETDRAADVRVPLPRGRRIVMKAFCSSLRLRSSCKLTIHSSPQTIESSPQTIELAPSGQRRRLRRGSCGTGTGVPDRRLAWRGGGTACAEASFWKKQAPAGVPVPHVLGHFCFNLPRRCASQDHSARIHPRRNETIRVRSKLSAFSLAGFVLFLLSLASFSFAADTGSIRGVITDPAGALIPGA